MANLRDMHSAVGGLEISPDDSNDITNAPCRAVYVGTAGTLEVILANDTAAVTLTNVPVGVHPLAIKRILSTGTTATGIVALY